MGLMPPVVESNIDEKNESWISIKEWLDEEPKGSMVYIALVSEVMVGLNEINELASGLELSGNRKPSKSRNIDRIVLPDDFDKRSKGQGIVWKSWAPQLKILIHDSIGGF
ncbi:hypothetical protein R3W88_028658 [Solanum pinnatisectum]|uniref:Uncharacterized protein n=1 Tax=Solanum pinnatisectum TaxID=50273 RepID=A0AAV9K3H9_9SOLN|nr:hypothetical protein R3W88_028658 [Solanum pinnatisectum]